jgi:transposase-like protein
LPPGVNAEGYRKILGVQVTSAEDGAGWLTFFRDLVARGLPGVGLVTSESHAGLVAAEPVVAQYDRVLDALVSRQVTQGG